MVKLLYRILHLARIFFLIMLFLFLHFSYVKSSVKLAHKFFNTVSIYSLFIYE